MILAYWTNFSADQRVFTTDVSDFSTIEDLFCYILIFPTAIIDENTR